MGGDGDGRTGVIRRIEMWRTSMGSLSYPCGESTLHKCANDESIRLNEAPTSSKSGQKASAHGTAPLDAHAPCMPSDA
jgi:hypothetical protein